MALPSSPDAPCAIEVINLTKQFSIHHKGSIKNRFMGFLRSWGSGRARRVEEFIALRDISFKVPQGQSLAVIGSNGSGKSTLLGLLARVYKPTTGEIRLQSPQGGRARVAPLLELGAGFHHELTGEDNIRFYGAMLGMSGREIAEKRDAIVQFAELEKKIDTPLHGWNDGAKLRLGFSIVVHTDPDIVLVDEVLVVGDEAFQNKCYRRITELKAQGKTIVFVSHDLTAVEKVADRVLWLKQGNIEKDGDVASTLHAYRSASVLTE